MKRGTIACDSCRGRGRRFMGYSTNGEALYSNAECEPCQGIGLRPTLNGKVIGWSMAFGIVDREQAQNVTPATIEREQGSLL